MTAWKHPARVAFETLHARGNVLIVVAVKVLGVDVPPQHRTGDALTLRFGAALKPAIVDQDIGDEKLEATLTFAGRWYRCIVPWHAIVAIAEDGAPAPAPPPAKRGGHLRLVS